MKVVYEHVPLPDGFPFDIFDQDLVPYYSMGSIMHFHDCFELSFASEGSCTYEIEDKSYRLDTGDLIVINNVEPHRMFTGRNGMQQTVIVFSPSLIVNGCFGPLDYDYIKAFAERAANFSNKISASDPMAAGIRETIEEIRTEFSQKQEGWQLMIKAKLLSLLTILYRYFLSSKTISDNTKNLLRIRPVLRLIDKDPSSPLLCDKDMADLLHVTKQHFCVLFKKATGQTFVSYLNTARINKCVRMLLETDSPVTQIAYECGFRNMSHFSKTFRDQTGMTPTAIRDGGIVHDK